MARVHSPKSAVERGKYRIQHVAEMTGVNPATLRAWERRYGVPSPQRTSKAYRLYSDDDVRAIRALKQLCDAGMAPAEAAESLRVVEPADEPVAADSYERAIAEIVASVEAFDPSRLEESTRKAMFLGSASTVFARVLSPVARIIGQRRQEGTISIAQEHLCTGVLTAVARDLLRLLEPAEGARRVLLACFAEEHDVVPLYGIAFAFHRFGFEPIVLGARTPPIAIADAVARLVPAFVALSVSISPSRADSLCRAYSSACGSVPLLVGGPAAPLLRREIAAVNAVLVRDLDDLRSTLAPDSP
jgi:DNA-binding transcriptional MerR regulator